ncbi:solute carrier family 35 member G1 [Caerostris extrusa]|uniref:Solute carrier family 35 member G1 n=1 Tax=Caerostris extrusa TaxID=172846 RepID=A0AAV4SCU6_CAEEX|nr:solute carrier family 35 member G1 [Caerostris extrusa]
MTSLTDAMRGIDLGVISGSHSFRVEYRVIPSTGPLERKPRKMSIFDEISLKLGSPIVDSKIEKPAVSQNNNNISMKEKPKSDKKKKAKSIIIGLTYGLFSGLFFAVCAASVKFLSDLDPGQVAFYQYIAITVFSLPMVIRNGGSLMGPDPSTKYWFLLCGIFDAFTVYLSFMSFRYLPLSDATVITSSIPVFVTVSARIFLKEKCGTFQIFAILISVAGVALVSKVPLLMASRTDVYTRESVIGLLASLGSMATESGVYLVLRKLQKVNVFIILFNFGVVATFINALLTILFGEFTLTTCGPQQAFVVAVGTFSFLSQLSLTKALEIEEAGPVSVLMAAGDIILAFIFDMTFFQDTPDIYTVSGTVLVITSVMLVGFKKWLDGNSKGSSLKLKFMKILF